MKYEILVKTGDVIYAGTDANIFLVFYGEKGEPSDPLRLNNLFKKANVFERNNLDRLELDFDKLGIGDIGKVVKIDLTSDMRYGGPDWFLDRITITRLGDDKDDLSNTASRFTFNAWINSKDVRTKLATIDNAHKHDAQIFTTTVIEILEAEPLFLAPNTEHEKKKIKTETIKYELTKGNVRKVTNGFDVKGFLKSENKISVKVEEVGEAAKTTNAGLEFAYKNLVETTEATEIKSTDIKVIEEHESFKVRNNTDKGQTYYFLSGESKSYVVVKLLDRLYVYPKEKKEKQFGYISEGELKELNIEVKILNKK